MTELLNGSGSLDATDANNTTRFPENMAPSVLNDGLRSLEGMLARYMKDDNGSLDLAGTGSAYTLSINADNGFALYEGWKFSAEVNTANTSVAPTITITPDGGSALTAQTITKQGGNQLALNDMVAGMLARFWYDGTNVELLNPAGTTITSTDAGAALAPTLTLHRDSASPADSDVIGGINFDGEDDGSAQTTYARVNAEIEDVTDTTEDGALVFSTMRAGTLTEALRIASDAKMTLGTGGTGADAYEIVIDSGSADGGGSALRFYQNGSETAIIGDDNYVSGSGSDLVIRARGTNELSLGAANTEVMRLLSNHDIRLSASTSALATNATGGFPGIPTCAGAPSGTPANASAGNAAMILDTSNSKIMFYDPIGASWVGVAVA